MGAVKRAWLGLPAGPDLRVPGEGEIAAAGELFVTGGIRVFGPGEEDFQGDSTGGQAPASYAA